VSLVFLSILRSFLSSSSHSRPYTPVILPMITLRRVLIFKYANTPTPFQVILSWVKPHFAMWWSMIATFDGVQSSNVKIHHGASSTATMMRWARKTEGAGTELVPVRWDLNRKRQTGECTCMSKLFLVVHHINPFTLFGKSFTLSVENHPRTYPNWQILITVFHFPPISTRACPFDLLTFLVRRSQGINASRTR